MWCFTHYAAQSTIVKAQIDRDLFIDTLNYATLVSHDRSNPPVLLGIIDVTYAAESH